MWNVRRRVQHSADPRHAINPHQQYYPGAPMGASIAAAFQRPHQSVVHPHYQQVWYAIAEDGLVRDGTTVLNHFIIVCIDRLTSSMNLSFIHTPPTTHTHTHTHTQPLPQHQQHPMYANMTMNPRPPQMYSTMGPRDPHLGSFRPPQHHQQRDNQQQQRMYPSMGTMGANPHGNPLWRTQKEVIEVCALISDQGASCMCVINLGADVFLLN